MYRDLNLPREFLEAPDWTDTFPESFRRTVSVPLRSFEYLIKLRDLMTNVKLKQMKIITDEHCPYAPGGTRTHYPPFLGMFQGSNNMEEFEGMDSNRIRI